MSIPEHARPPAWAGLEPAEPVLQRVTDARGLRIIAAIGREGRLLGRSPEARSNRYFTFVPEDGSRRLFIKTVGAQWLESQLQANRVAEWLADNALAVSTLLPSYPRRLDPQHHLLAYNLIDGRFARADADDVLAIGRLLGQIHHTLRSLPWAHEIRDRSALRDALFERWHAEQSQNPDTPAAVREVLVQSSPQLAAENGQVIHGDLNIGNLLVGRGSGHPALLDFEDALHNWHHPLVDLAMALERFVLVRCTQAEQAEQLGKALIDGYLATAPQLPLPQQRPQQMLQSLATRALLLLGNSSDSASVRAEQEKFIALHQLADQQAYLLERLWARLWHEQ